MTPSHRRCSVSESAPGCQSDGDTVTAGGTAAAAAGKSEMIAAAAARPTADSDAMMYQQFHSHDVVNIVQHTVTVTCARPRRAQGCGGSLAGSGQSPRRSP